MARSTVMCQHRKVSSSLRNEYMCRKKNADIWNTEVSPPLFFPLLIINISLHLKGASHFFLSIFIHVSFHLQTTLSRQMKKKGPFSPEEDQIILNIIQNWDNIGVSQSEDKVSGITIDHTNIGEDGSCCECKGEMQGGIASLGSNNIQGNWYDESFCTRIDTDLWDVFCPTPTHHCTIYISSFFSTMFL